MRNKKPCSKNKKKMPRPWKSAWPKNENSMNKKLWRMLERELRKRERPSRLLLLRPRKHRKKPSKKLRSFEFNKSREQSCSKFKSNKKCFLNNKKKNK